MTILFWGSGTWLQPWDQGTKVQSTISIRTTNQDNHRSGAQNLFKRRNQLAESRPKGKSTKQGSTWSCYELRRRSPRSWRMTLDLPRRCRTRGWRRSSCRSDTLLGDDGQEMVKWTYRRTSPSLVSFVWNWLQKNDKVHIFRGNKSFGKRCSKCHKTFFQR